MTKRQKIYCILLVALIAFLLFWRIARHDMLGDDAHYAFRSIGYFDYLASKEQTTPVQWFGDRPAWSLLSFHDHPPLYFLIQFIFFKILGVSVFVARLPSALAAIGSALVMFFWAKKLLGIKAGLLSLVFLAVNSYFIWMGRVGLLESLFTFFLLLGLFYLHRALTEQSRLFAVAGLFFGLCFLTKYTFLFAAPGIFIYLLWKHREVFSNRKFWKGAFIFALICLPVIVYNIALFKTRGHFDVQFTDLFGQNNLDRSNLTDRVSGFYFTPLNVISVLADGVSWPFFIVFLVSFFSAFYLAIKKNLSALLLPLLVFLSFFMIFSVVGNANRWLGVVAPFMSFIVTLSVSRFFENRPGPNLKKYLAGMSLGLVGIFCLFYTINTNNLRKTVGDTRFYADFRVPNYGYNQLGKEVNSMLARKSIPEPMQRAVTLWWYKEIQNGIGGLSLGPKPHRPDFRSLIIYDSNTSWFPTMWIFERWKFYDRALITTAEEFLKIAQSAEGPEILKFLELDGIYYIRSSDLVAADSRMNFKDSKTLEQDYIAQNIAPKIIYDDEGREAFYIYHRSFK